MRILLTNDDGIRAIGLRSMYAALVAAGHEVRVIAPMRQQSGVGHSLTVFTPLRVQHLNEDHFTGIGLYGTPTDCVKLGLACLLDTRPDMVISGINAGSNVGPDILYSGTVGAATEAAHEGIPTLAISCNQMHPENLDAQARHAVALAEKLDWTRIPERRVINVNYPACPPEEAKGLRICPQTSAVWVNGYEERQDPHGEPYWWLRGEIPAHTVNAGSDKDLLDRGYITITPLKFDFTDRETMQALTQMDLEHVQLPLGK